MVLGMRVGDHRANFTSFVEMEHEEERNMSGSHAENVHCDTVCRNNYFN